MAAKKAAKKVAKKTAIKKPSPEKKAKGEKELAKFVVMSDAKVPHDLTIFTVDGVFGWRLQNGGNHETVGQSSQPYKGKGDAVENAGVLLAGWRGVSGASIIRVLSNV